MTKKSLRLLYKQISGILNMGAYHAKKILPTAVSTGLVFWA